MRRSTNSNFATRDRPDCESPNHPELREVYTLPLLLARAFTLAPEDTVMYAHGKGVSWIGHEFETPTRWWSLAMYRYLFSAPAMNAATQFPVTGWLKFEGPPPGYFPAWSKWHYVGTFFWFRAVEIYRRPPSEYRSAPANRGANG